MVTDPSQKDVGILKFFLSFDCVTVSLSSGHVNEGFWHSCSLDLVSTQFACVAVSAMRSKYSSFKKTSNANRGGDLHCFFESFEFNLDWLKIFLSFPLPDPIASLYIRWENVTPVFKQVFSPDFLKDTERSFHFQQFIIRALI